MFNFNKDRLNLKEPLETVHFGEVFPYQKDPSNLKWVIKRITAKNTKEFINCLPEILFGFSCDHPCIVPVKGYLIEEMKESGAFQVYLKIPRMKESLFKNFKDRKMANKPFTQEEIIRHFYSLVCGLQYLHSKKIYHGDIRLENLLFDEKGNLKIANIGVVKHIENTDIRETAPEVSSEKVQKEQLAKAYIWSLGLVMLELCTFELGVLKSSFSPQEKEKQIKKTLEDLEGKYHKNLLQLIKETLSFDPKQRPTIDTIKARLEKDFSQNIDQDLVNFDKPSSPQINHQLFQDQIKVLTQQTKKLEVEREEFTKLKSQFSECLSKHQEETKKVNGSVMPLTFGSTLLLIFIVLAAFLSGLFTTQILGYQPRQTLQEKHQITSELRDLLHSLKEGNTSDEQGIITTERHLETFMKDEIRTNKSRTKRESQPNIKAAQSDWDKFKKIVSDLNSQHKEWLQFRGYKQLTLQIEPQDNVNKQEIKDEHFISIFQDLAKMLEENHLSLFGLFVFCPECRSLTSETFASLNALTLTKTLHEIKFDFEECDQLNSTAIEQITKVISSQPLERLRLSFRGWTQLTNEAFISLTTAISSQTLKGLFLFFDGCNQLNDTALQSLAITISAQRLQRIHLDFSENPKITDKGLMSLGKAISESQQTLQSLTVHLKETVSQSPKEPILSEFVDFLSTHLRDLAESVSFSEE